MSWSSRWRSLLPAGRAERERAQGAAFARSGRVSDLRATTGAVVARVQGARATPYLVEVAVPPLNDADWRTVVDTVATRARHEAQLLADQVPDGLEDDLRTAGVRLFVPWSELDPTCPCGSGGRPCAHVTGLWEAVAQRLDLDPFLWLRARGRGRQRLLAEISAARRRTAVRPSGLPLAELRTDGWTRADAPLEDLHPGSPAAPETPAGPLRLLGDPPGWAGNVGAGDLFAPLVERAAGYARRLLATGGADESAQRAGE